MNLNMIVRYLFCFGFLVFSASCTTPTRSNSTNGVAGVNGLSSSFMSSQDEGKRPSGRVDLDSKALSRIIKGYQAVIQNDDQKAKLAYGRAHKYMPEFLQFAYDLRFRNFTRALKAIPKLPYSNDEKEFWTNLINKRPPVISRYVCDWLKDNKFAFKSKDADSTEALWFSEYVTTSNDLQAKYFSKNPPKRTELDSIFEKYKFINDKREPLALSAPAQNELLNEAFFDKFRNMQRRDTNYYRQSFRNTYQTLTYTPYFKAQNAWDFYWALEATNHPRKAHYLRRLKGIVKDMRQDMIFYRIVGSKLIQDSEDYNKALSIGYFITRFPIISAFLRFEFSLNDCAYTPLKE